MIAVYLIVIMSGDGKLNVMFFYFLNDHYDYYVCSSEDDNVQFIILQGAKFIRVQHSCRLKKEKYILSSVNLNHSIKIICEDYNIQKEDLNIVKYVS